MREAKSAPIDIAQLIRNEIKLALEQDREYRGEMSLTSAACVLGVPQETLGQRFSMLLVGDGNTISLTVGDSQTTALEALQSWQRQDLAEGGGDFAFAQYRAIFGLVQAGYQGLGREVMQSVLGLWLKMAEQTDENWQRIGLSGRLEEFGSVLDDDIPHIQMGMTRIQEQVPVGMRKDLPPVDRLFQR